ncbi:MAG: conserved membrane protein of unknown function [Candidatus Thorarchaeota archaeon]|nr:MAG: conserved membrane protein of unknown function [Candidatus Thorarchaeota archaeon]
MASPTSENDIEPFEPSIIDGERSVIITVYGGEERSVLTSFKENIGDCDQHSYHTWVNVRAMKRLLFLFDGGVESAGGIFEIICVFAIMLITLALFAFWQIVIYFIVMIVLALFTGGVALKYIRGTFIEVEPTKLPPKLLNEFVKKQLIAGNFVRVEAPKNSINLESITKSSNRATQVFEVGVKLSLLVGTLFFIAQIAFRIWMNEWLSDITAITIFGLTFLTCILITDVGVILRHRLEKQLDEESEN